MISYLSAIREEVSSLDKPRVKKNPQKIFFLDESTVLLCVEIFTKQARTRLLMDPVLRGNSVSRACLQS